VEPVQPQGLEVEQRARAWIGREQDLEAPVEEEAVHFVRPYPPADDPIALHDEHTSTGLAESDSACEPGHASADDDGVVLGWWMRLPAEVGAHRRLLTTAIPPG
jgi:hypothetical protein